jgi:hypothetical protein
MSEPLTQINLDQVASFVEGCAELEREPFFGKDEKLSFQSAGNRWTFTFGDRFHFRSALVSFRRLWMKTEPSNWETVVSILKQPGLPQLVSSFAEHHEQMIRAILSREMHMLKLNMRSNRIIDLWLNTVFAHTGLEGRNKRHDFEAAVDQYGHAVFEFCFRSLVREIGFEFLNICNLAAKPALDSVVQTAGMSPSFRIGAAFGAKRREKTREGHLIVREGSSEFFSEETLEEKFARVLERHENREVKFVFKHLDASVNELLRGTLARLTLANILNSIEGKLEIRSLKLGELAERQGFRACWAIQRSPIHIMEDCVVITDELGVKVLDEKLEKFRQQLLKD